MKVSGKKTTRRVLTIMLAFLVASAFTLAVPQETFAASKKCKTPKITYAKAENCKAIYLRYGGAGRLASTYFVYMKAPGGKYKLVKTTKYNVFTDGRIIVSIGKLKPNTKYTFKVRAAKAYKQKQYYNTKTKKWQAKKPKKKYWKGKKTRKVLKYKWYSKYSKAKTVKTDNHTFVPNTRLATFFSAGTTTYKCFYCGAKKPTEYFGTAGEDQKLSVTATAEKNGSGTPGVYLFWLPASGATGYIVERAEADGAYQDIYYSRDSSYFDSNIQEGKQYHYRVTAYHNMTSSGTWYSKTSSTTEITLSDPLPSDMDTVSTANKEATAYPIIGKVSGLKITPGYITANLTWSSVTGARKYLIYQGDEKIDEVTSCSYTATGLVPLTSYSFHVVAVRDSLKGVASAVTETKTNRTPTPSNIRATGTFDSVTLSWDAVDGAEIYVIDTPSGTYTQTDLTFTETGLESNKRYTFYVRARVCGKYSEKLAGKAVGKTGFQAPANLQATKIMEYTAVLTWDPVDGADSYRIYKSNGTSLVKEVQDCSYRLTGLDRKTTYSYYVVAGAGGEYGVLDDSNKVTFTTIEIAYGFTPNEDIKLTYGGVTFYLGQTWSPSLLSSLKAASNGYESASRPGFAYDFLTHTEYDAVEHMFDVDDYSNFLAVIVADGKIVSWQSNGPVFGTYYGTDVIWGDNLKDYPYGRRTAYRTSGSACDNIFTDIDRGDTVIGGFEFVMGAYTDRQIITDEKRIGYHFINAYRVAAELSILTYSNELDGGNEVWSGTARGKQWTNTRYGQQAFAETDAASKPNLHGIDLHDTENMTEGPLAGQTMNERDAIVFNATGVNPTGENAATGGIGESCLGSYMSSNAHLKNIVRQDVALIGIGLYDGYNTQVYAK